MIRALDPATFSKLIVAPADRRYQRRRQRDARRHADRDGKRADRGEQQRRHLEALLGGRGLAMLILDLRVFELLPGAAVLHAPQVNHLDLALLDGRKRDTQCLL